LYSTTTKHVKINYTSPKSSETKYTSGLKD